MSNANLQSINTSLFTGSPKESRNLQEEMIYQLLFGSTWSPRLKRASGNLNLRLYFVAVVLDYKTLLSVISEEPPIRFPYLVLPPKSDDLHVRINVSLSLSFLSFCDVPELYGG